MSDEERIAKLQKLLDRVLTRGEAEEPPDSHDGVSGSSGERTQISGDPPPEAAPPAAEPPALERSADPSDHRVLDTDDDDPTVPLALESRSRLVTAQPDADAEELSPDDLVPASESSSELDAVAVPLVRRSKRPIIVPAHDPDKEPLSEGRVPLNLQDVQIEDEEKSLAEEIAAEEVHSGEIGEHEEEEEAPVSSRRPIDSEAAAREEDDSPPESGKQVAAAPFDAPQSGESRARKSNQPPTSGRVGPEVMRTELSSSTRVGSIVPPVPPRPATFGELIERALDF
jgi:hypothetical protein